MHPLSIYHSSGAQPLARRGAILQYSKYKLQIQLQIYVIVVIYLRANDNVPLTDVHGLKLIRIF